MNVDSFLVDDLQILVGVKRNLPFDSSLVYYGLESIVVNNSDRKVKANVLKAD